MKDEFYKDLYSNLYEPVEKKEDPIKEYKNKIASLEKRIVEQQHVINTVLEENKTLKEKQKDLNKQIFKLILQEKQNEDIQN